MYCDLHTHSTFSDGTLTPTEIIIEAKRAGLCAVALTDHNSISGLKEFKNAAAENCIDGVCGVEFSCQHRETELHLLGLFLPEDCFAELKSYLSLLKKWKDESNRGCMQRLSDAGYPVSYEELEKEFPNVYINRVHMARLLIKKGIISTVEEGFRTLLSTKYPYYRHARGFDFLETVEKIKKCGGVAVWAHPPLHMSFEQIEEFMPIAKAHGLDGAETMYSTYSQAEEEFMKRVVRQNDLLESGGSDFHGANKPLISLGTGMGNLAVPDVIYFKLKAKAETIR